ncbi:hypothetical protein BJY01DRAFT_108837 [Aspergillus pseudoustus]|uniref:Mid2 domain-containing protein n=1 Tax=Aspergillus pseudoustus TaxID=1810923 RepID=A0ABR4IU46_9EURO
MRSQSTLPFVLALVALFSLAFASGDSDSDSDSDSESGSHALSPTSTNTTTATCYNLDGSRASDHVPCQSGDVVNCCNAGDICLSNGLCFQQGNRGMVLSRGSCTDHSWGARCYAPCSDYRRNGTVPIVNAGFDSDEPEYCCGSVTVSDDDSDDDDVSCEYGDGPFSIPRGTAIPGVAGLSKDALDDDDDDDHDEEDEDKDDDEDHITKSVSPGLAIALGIGIPVGLLLMGGVLWAVWERRRRQLKIEEEDGRSSAGMTLGAMKLPGLHHRYGPVPSPVPTYSARHTPNGSQSALFQPVHQSPLSSPPVSPPNSPPQSPPRDAERGRFQFVDDREDNEEERGRRP